MTPARDSAQDSVQDSARDSVQDSVQDSVRVRLLGVPVRVLAASREHHDDLVREFRLLAVSGRFGAHEPPPRLVQLTSELGVRYATVRESREAAIVAAVEQGHDTLDVEYDVPPSTGAAVEQIEELITSADEFCRSEQLLTLPRTPVLVDFARWYLSQFADQLAGRPAVRWDGPLDP